MLFTAYCIILIEGFVTISIEMVVIRQLIPFFGNSVIITSIIIGIFLLFLALGYWRGGFIKSHFLERMHKNFTIALLITGLGFSYLFIHYFFYMGFSVLQAPILMVLVLYLLLTLAPVIYLLGQTVPLTTNLFSKEQTVAGISGRALFLSTIGSFLGAIATTLVLFNFVGVGFSIFFNGVLLLILIIHIQYKINQRPTTLLFLVVMMGLIYLINVDAEKVLFVKTNNYANYQVQELKLDKVLIINNSYSSKVQSDKKGFEYIEKIKDILLNQLNLRDKTILVIGAGGFSLSFENSHGNHFDYVDVDSEIKAIAEQSFLLGRIQGQFYGEDGRLYLNKSQKKYDVIISDVYTSSHSVPAALATREYFTQIRNALKPEGLLIANIIAQPFFADPYSKAIHNTIHSVFNYCMVEPLSWGKKPANILYVCPKIRLNVSRIYSDDLNSVTLDYFKMIRP